MAAAAQLGRQDAKTRAGPKPMSKQPSPKPVSVSEPNPKGSGVAEAQRLDRGGSQQQSASQQADTKPGETKPVLTGRAKARYRGGRGQGGKGPGPDPVLAAAVQAIKQLSLAGVNAIKEICLDVQGKQRGGKEQQRRQQHSKRSKNSSQANKQQQQPSQPVASQPAAEAQQTDVLREEQLPQQHATSTTHAAAPCSALGPKPQATADAAPTATGLAQLGAAKPMVFRSLPPEAKGTPTTAQQPVQVGQAGAPTPKHFAKRTKVEYGAIGTSVVAPAVQKSFLMASRMQGYEGVLTRAAAAARGLGGPSSSSAAATARESQREPAASGPWESVAQAVQAAWSAMVTPKKGPT